MKASPYHEKIVRGSRIGPVANNILSKDIFGIGDLGAKILSSKITPDLEVNSCHFRSDEFKKEHSEKHFLFAGCSNTFGVGLKKEELWANRFLSKLSDSGEKFSGYFNLSIPGNSVFEVVTNVMKYCNKYSNPDVIFIQLPNILRFYNVDLANNTLVTSNLFTSKKDDQLQGLNSILGIHTYQYLLFLELFCKSNSIKLFILSWPPHGHFESDPELENFYIPEVKEIARFIRDYMDNHLEDPYSLYARDNGHPGNAQQEYWAQTAYNLYNKSVRENNVN
jgi:hypothetical protein